MNYDHYDYIPVKEYPNVLLSRPKGQQGLGSPPFEYMLSEPMKPMVDKLTKLRPLWAFVVVSAGIMVNSSASTSNLRYVRRLQVWQSNELLGSIDIGTSYRGGNPTIVYQYDNDRLSARRQRGAWTQSSKLDVAVKGILKSFTPKNVAELLSAKMRMMGNAISTNSSRASREFNQDFNTISHAMPKFVMNNWDVMSEMLRGSGIGVSNDLPELFAEKKAKLDMYEAFNSSGGGVVVLTRGADYIVAERNRDGDQVQVFSSDTLPASIKRNLGLLKLAQNEQAVNGVGLRLDENSYFVMTKESTHD